MNAFNVEPTSSSSHESTSPVAHANGEAGLPAGTHSAAFAGVQNALTRKTLPGPTWAWAVLGGVAALALGFLVTRNTAAPTASGHGAATGTEAAAKASKAAEPAKPEPTAANSAAPNSAAPGGVPTTPAAAPSEPPAASAPSGASDEHAAAGSDSTAKEAAAPAEPEPAKKGPGKKKARAAKKGPAKNRHAASEQ